MYYRFESYDYTLYLRNTDSEGYQEYIPCVPGGDPHSTADFRNVVSVVTEEKPLILPESTYFMFHNCVYLENIDVSDWDASNVYTMVGMFNNCSSLKKLDLSTWDVRKCEYFTSMFSSSGFEVINIMNWQFNENELFVVSSMFSGCSSLKVIFNDDNWLEKWGSTILASETLFESCRKLPGWDYDKLTVEFAKPISEGGYFSTDPKTWKACTLYMKV